MSSDFQNTYALLKAPQVIEIHRETLPETPRPDYVRLRIAHCALCGSDLAFYRGRPGAVYPRTLGHEYHGVIESTGEDITAFHSGDRVAVDPNYRCGTCFYCKSGASNLCDQSEANLFDQRGLSAWVDVHQSYLHRLPEMRLSYLGALIEPLSCALHAISLAAVNRDDRILILGCGGQGSMLIFALTSLRPGLDVHIYDPNRARARNLAQVFSPGCVLLNSPPAHPEYTLIFEASGRTMGFKLAARSLTRGGRIVIISRYSDRRTVYLPADFPRRQGTIIFSHLNGNGESFTQARELLQNAWRSRHEALVQVQPFRELPSALAKVDRSPFSKTIFEMP
jgi:(R,R)-butanediol dehydrogenase/meso-butanediol dehydrogenase/diacetyl reductase